MIAPPKPPSYDDLEALIREARERQLRRRLLGAAGIAIAVAIGLSAYALVAGGNQRRGTVSRRQPKAVVAPCSAADGWRLKLGPGWSEPTGQHTATIALTRLASNACSMSGYPRIVLQDSRGRTLPFRYSHRGDMVVTSHPPSTVRVDGGASAFFIFNKYRCDVHTTAIARRLLVHLPGVRGWLKLRLADSIIDYCPTAGPSTTIAVSPLVARLPQAAARLP
jgi:hypothetical protein